MVSVESRVRRIEKNPSPKRLKANVVTTEKLGFRAVTTKTVAADAITANEAGFGVTVVSATDPDIVKEGTTVVDPTTGAQKVYSEDISAFVTVTDPAAQAAADSKSAVYYQDNEPAGTAYEVGDIWIDTNDNDKLYAWDGTDWVLSQDSASAQATADGKAKTYVQNDEPTGGAYNVGDLWIDTNDGNKLYRYSGTAWVSAQDTAISTAQSTANGKNKVFYSTSAPGSTANTAGDIWWQYSSGVVVGQFVGAGGTSWTSAPIGNAVIANLDAGKITTGFLDVAGTVKITTSATASGTGGFTPRIEINSSGFFAYNGSVATVSITNTGTAVFSGTVNATAGAFTGYVTGGTARFGAAVQTGKNGIYINASNYWYDDGSFKAGTGTSAITYDGSGTLTIGAGSSIGGTTASTLVSNAAEGATALQEGNGVSKNGSDQITTISTASGIVVGTAPTATGNTARVVINSGGFFAYDGTGETVGITSAGVARFKGTITGSSFQSTNYASGNGIRIYESGSLDRIELDAASDTKLAITANSSGAVIFGPTSLAFISMPNGGSVFISTNSYSGAQVSFATTGAVVNSVGYTAGAKSFRNILASATPLTNGAAATGYLEGEIYLVY